MKRIVVGSLWVVLMLSGRSIGWGYEEAPVKDGGTLGGKVVLQGTPPPSRIFHLIFSPNIDFCGRVSDGKGNRLMKEFRVSDGGGLQGAIVAVVGVERGKPFDYRPEITIQDCRISPFVTPVRNNHPVHLVNNDPIAHDVQAYTLKEDYTFAMFNKPLTPKSSAVKQVKMRPGHYILRTQCGVHDYMQSWGMAIGNPYFAVTAADGTFTIPDLPPGTYDVIAWHPHLKVQAQQVTISENGKADLIFQFDAAEVDIPLHDLQTGYRLQTALQEHHLIPPVELQTP